jgi:S1-C subfamily serine protease
LTTAFAAALVANAGETLAAPLPAFPVAAPSEQVQSEQDRRIMRALAGPHIPAGVQGMRRFGVGSGIFIAPNRVLSNFHVAGECRALTVGNNTEGEEVDAALLAGDPQQDLVVLSADEPDVHPAQFLTAGFKQSQDDLAIVGYPEHGLPVLQAELYRASVFQDDLEKPGPRYSFFGNVRRGNSGGPLLNAQGAVVGVVTAKIDTVAVYRKTGEVIDDLGIAISNRTVFDFLAANHIPFEPAAERPKLSSDELLQLAHGFVRQVSCWK